MSKKKLPYTPKPWHVQQDLDSWGTYIVEEANRQCETLYNQEDEEATERANQIEEANRLLIESVPELVEAAIEVLRRWEKGNLSEPIQKLAKAVCKARPDLHGRVR